MRSLYRAESIIQRDALRAALTEAGIDSLSPDRDMSRKMTDTTVDLSLGGYSDLFDGFQVFVHPSDRDRAEEVLKNFLAQTDPPPKTAEVQAPDDLWKRYYQCTIFSIMFPGVMSLPATYYLYLALRSGQRTGKAYLIFSLLCLVSGWVVAFGLAYQYLSSWLDRL